MREKVMKADRKPKIPEATKIPAIEK